MAEGFAPRGLLQLGLGLGPEPGPEPEPEPEPEPNRDRVPSLLLRRRGTLSGMG